MNDTNFIKAVETVNAIRNNNPDVMFKRLGRWMGWSEMGSDADIAYRILGKHILEYGSADGFVDYIEEELCSEMVDVREFVETFADVPMYLNVDEVYGDLTRKVAKSLWHGGTGQQMIAYVKKECEKMRDKTYKPMRV